MTILKYLLSTGVCTTAELLAFKRENPADYDSLMQMARDQAAHNDVEITEK